MADPVLVSAVLEALTAHLREKRPDWHVTPTEFTRGLSVGRSPGAHSWSRATVSVQGVVAVNARRVAYTALDDLPALCRKVEAKIAEGFAAEDAADKRREQEREDEAKREAARERRDARRAEQREAHPLAFGAGVDFKPDGWGLVLPERGDLAAVALAAVEAHLRARRPSPVCGGVLHYETLGGVMRVHREGRYRYRCSQCGDAGENDGTPRTCSQKAKAAAPEGSDGPEAAAAPEGAAG